MSDLVPLSFEGRSIRPVVMDGEPWLVAPDVCAALSLRDTSSALKMVDPEDLRRLRRSDTPQYFGGIAPQVQEITVVNESGVYALIFHSRKPEAKRFKRWVTHEVLPAFRRGEIAIVERETTTPAELSRLELIEIARAAELERLELEQKNAALTELNVEQSRELSSARPKAAYVDAFIDPRDDVMTIGDFAKQLGLRHQQLRDYLVTHKVIYRKHMGNRWSGSKGKEEPVYEWRACAGKEPWFTTKRHHDVEQRLYNGQVASTLYVNPIGMLEIIALLEKRPIDGSGHTGNLRALPAPRQHKKKGGAA